MSGERGDRDLKRRRFFQILGEVDDSLIEEAEGAAPKKQGRGWLPWTALAACCLIVLGLGQFASQFFRAGSAAPATGNSMAAQDRCV